MPRLWNETMEAHRRAVRDATLEATASLVAERGLLSVTMSEVAQRAGIGRATLYKYYPDVETILAAWHARRVSAHLERLARVRDETREVGKRLEAVLEAYAFIQRERAEHDHGPYGGGVAAFLHRDQQVALAQEHLLQMIENLLKEGAAAGYVRDDVAAHELATYCIHAIHAASRLSSEKAAHRLVSVTMAGLRPPLDPP